MNTEAGHQSYQIKCVKLYASNSAACFWNICTLLTQTECERLRENVSFGISLILCGKPYSMLWIIMLGTCDKIPLEDLKYQHATYHTRKYNECLSKCWSLINWSSMWLLKISILSVTATVIMGIFNWNQILPSNPVTTFKPPSITICGISNPASDYELIIEQSSIPRSSVALGIANHKTTRAVV